MEEIGRGTYGKVYINYPNFCIKCFDYNGKVTSYPDIRNIAYKILHSNCYFKREVKNNIKVHKIFKNNIQDTSLHARICYFEGYSFTIERNLYNAVVLRKFDHPYILKWNDILFVQLVKDTLKFLAKLNSKGYLHNDISRNNIFYDDDHFVVADYGNMMSIKEFKIMIENYEKHMNHKYDVEKKQINKVDIVKFHKVLIEIIDANISLEKFRELIKPLVEERNSYRLSVKQTLINIENIII